ncbi:MAG: Wzz/FepE/Etk N-terminal domain-containing protein [Anaerolineae bacterium]
MELSRVASTLRRWWWLIVLLTLLGIAAGYVAEQRLPAVYYATSTVMVGRAIENPNPTNTEISLGQQLALTYGEIARRRPVQDAAKAALGLNGLPEYSVFQVPNTQLLEISRQRWQSSAGSGGRQRAGAAVDRSQPQRGGQSDH